MNVFLTIDVETYTGDYERDVWADGLGLRHILDQLKTYGHKATFFVEALGGTRWGVDGIKKICDAVQEDGHEAGLHIHPVVANIGGFHDHSDKLYDHDLTTQTMLISKGREILERCGVKQVGCFRAGDFAADENTLRAMQACGITIGSNRDLDRKGSIKSRANDLFPVVNDLSTNGEVIDLPLSCFASPLSILDGCYRHLQVCAVSSAEMRNALCGMQDAGYKSALLLTHPQEFFSSKRGGMVPTPKNCRRCERLLAMVDASENLITTTVSAAHDMDVSSVSPPEVRGSFASASLRVLEQAMYRFL